MNSMSKVESDFGKNLLKAAIEKQRGVLTDQAVTEVTRIMQRIDATTQHIEADTRVVALLNKQLVAIESGEFSMVRSPVNSEMVIVYNDHDIIEPNSVADLIVKRQDR